MLENLGAVQKAIKDGDHQNAIQYLKDLQSNGMGYELVETQIARIESGEIHSVDSWIMSCLAQYDDDSEFFEEEEISIAIGVSTAGFQLSESDFNTSSKVDSIGLIETSQGKRAKLKAKLAKLKKGGETVSKLIPLKKFELKKQETKNVARDPFAGLMDDVTSNAFKPNDFGEASKSTNSTKEGIERSRDETPIATSAIREKELGLSESSATQYRGEPRLKENSASITANKGFTRGDKTGIDSAAISFISEEPHQSATNLGAIRLEAKRLLDAGELDAALDITKKILSRNDDSVTLRLREEIRQKIEKRNLEYIGDLSNIPSIRISMAELSNYTLDHRAGFLLSMIDGTLSYEDIIDLSGIPRETVLDIISNLSSQNIIFH